MMPTNVAARMTLAADPGSLQGAVAAGILGCGPVILGTAEACARLLERARERDPGELAREIRAAGGKLPGFGHPVHKPLDPRAERILELADERGVAGEHVALARAFRDAAAEAWGRPLTMNVSMPIAAVMLDLGFPAATVKAVPILARTASLLAHLAEEREQPLGFLMAGAAEEADPLRGAMTDARPTTSSSPTCSSARRSTATKLAGHDTSGGLADDRGAAADRPSRSCATTVTRGEPVRRAPVRRAGARSSGSTPPAARPATPSYIPLTASDLENWIETSARSYAASGVQPGERIVTTYNAGPFAAGAALAAFERIGAHATSRSAPATPSGCCARSSCCAPTRS